MFWIAREFYQDTLPLHRQNLAKKVQVSPSKCIKTWLKNRENSCCALQSRHAALNLEDFEQIDGTKVAFLGGVPKTFYSGLGMNKFPYLSNPPTYF